jgi:hypothetical protein
VAEIFPLATLNAPHHPLPIAQTPGDLLRRNMPDIMHRYIQFWHAAICRQPLHEFEQWYDPVLTYLARGSGHGAQWSFLLASRRKSSRRRHLFSSAHSPLLVTVSPTERERFRATTELFLVDNGPQHGFNIPGAGPQIWVDNANNAQVHGTTEVSGPFPKLHLQYDYDEEEDAETVELVKTYEDWKAGRFGHNIPWTVDSASPRCV